MHSHHFRYVCDGMHDHRTKHHNIDRNYSALPSKEIRKPPRKLPLESKKVRTSFSGIVMISASAPILEKSC